MEITATTINSITKYYYLDNIVVNNGNLSTPLNEKLVGNIAKIESVALLFK